MRWCRHLALALAVCSFFPLSAVCTTGRADKLIVLLLDGFRPEYWTRQGLAAGGFSRVLRDGAHAIAMTPDFPSSSYPNYYTLMTGLHTESHGMTSNFMYDVKTRKVFLIGSNAAAKLPMWWEKAEPLWIAAERQGKAAYFYYWPGCDVRIQNRVPHFCKPYPGSAPGLEDLDWAIADGVTQLSNGTADIVGIYVELADKVGHFQGANSSHMQKALEELDRRMAVLLDKLEAEHLEDRVNVVIFSDHGMTVTTKEYYAVNVSEHVKDSDVVIEINEGTTVGYWPRIAAVDRVYNALKKVPHADAYMKEEIPERYHYKRGPFVPPIILVLRPPYVAVTNQRPWPRVGGTEQLYVGFHGYDPDYEEMKASFAAIGPAFRPGARVATMHSVDVYQLLCTLAAINPEPNNGTWSAVAELLVWTKPKRSNAPVSSREPCGIALTLLASLFSSMS